MLENPLIHRLYSLRILAAHKTGSTHKGQDPNHHSILENLLIHHLYSLRILAVHKRGSTRNRPQLQECSRRET
jgi:hypothetical protein